MKKILPPLCPTRWTVRGRALDSVLSNYELVIESLDELSDEPGSTGAEAAGFSAKCYGSRLSAIVGSNLHTTCSL